MKSLKEYINEGLYSALIIQAQLTKAQWKIFDYFEKHANDYNNEFELLRDLKKVSQDAYNEFVKEPDAIPFSKWFHNFEKSFINYLKNSKK